MNDFNLKNRWDQPSKSLPIIFIGAGGIIRNAHLPAYNKLNLNIAGVYDLNLETAKTLAKDFNIPKCILHSLCLISAIPCSSENDTETQALQDTLASIRCVSALKGNSKALLRAPVSR